MDEGNKECTFRRVGWVSVQQDGWPTGAPHITHGGNNGIVCRFVHVSAPPTNHTEIVTSCTLLVHVTG